LRLGPSFQLRDEPNQSLRWRAQTYGHGKCGAEYAEPQGKVEELYGDFGWGKGQVCSLLSVEKSNQWRSHSKNSPWKQNCFKGEKKMQGEESKQEGNILLRGEIQCDASRRN